MKNTSRCFLFVKVVYVGNKKCCRCKDTRCIRERNDGHNRTRVLTTGSFEVGNFFIFFFFFRLFYDFGKTVLKRNASGARVHVSYRTRESPFRTAQTTRRVKSLTFSRFVRVARRRYRFAGARQVLYDRSTYAPVPSACDVSQQVPRVPTHSRSVLLLLFGWCHFSMFRPPPDIYDKS